jgi:hypothetical protein
MKDLTDRQAAYGGRVDAARSTPWRSGDGLVDLDGSVAFAVARLGLDAHVDVDVEGLGDIGDGSQIWDRALTGEQAGDDGSLDAEASCHLGLRHLLGLADVLQLLEKLG